MCSALSQRCSTAWLSGADAREETEMGGDMNSSNGARRRFVVLRSLIAAVLLACLGSGTACSSDVQGEPNPTWQIFERLLQGGVDKMDILLVVDNSRSMADKQMILRTAVPDLVSGLTNPPCVDDEGSPAGSQPPGPLDACPAGTQRQFAPITDIHIGVISSSLGGHGADSCDATSFPSENDKAHLVTRSGTEQGDPAVPTWENKGFLVWDPFVNSPSHNPPGETDINALIGNLNDMVGGVGEVGCGFEASLEAWYRFLIERVWI